MTLAYEQCLLPQSLGLDSPLRGDTTIVASAIPTCAPLPHNRLRAGMGGDDSSRDAIAKPNAKGARQRASVYVFGFVGAGKLARWRA